ncbi:MAG: MoxR family ATPase [Bacteroidetes bacterium]|nr:MoxR family ATPase [Bacteroidota bacterium]
MEHENPQFENRTDLSELQQAVADIKQELHKIIIGQDHFIELLLVALIADGHVLIEGVPGIAKTITAKLFAKTLKTDFSRIQFTPDLMPSDVLGTSVYNQQSNEFELKKGPIFSNIVLIDEINRAPAKTQAALFEVMEERQITIDGKTQALKAPFMVLATQNPIEQEGTYALPEAQLDRFLFKINVGYPDPEEEIAILKTHQERKNEAATDIVQAVLNTKTIAKIKAMRFDVRAEPNMLKYITDLVVKTRNHPYLYLGASPRASLAIMNAAKVFAAMDGRDFIIPEDVKKCLAPVLQHRIVLNPEKEMEGFKPEQVIDMIVKSVDVPR